MNCLISKSPRSCALSRRISRATFSNRSAAALQRICLSTMEASAPDEGHSLALILGKPGGGKGTISHKILKDFQQFHHVSTGDILRQHVREGTSLGIEAKKYMDKGKLVPDELMISLVMEQATPNSEFEKILLLDGFPRTVVQAQALEEVVHVDLVINLDVPTETIVDRIADRWIHPASGRIYSYSYKPPKEHGKDDVTGEPLIQRDDDKPECVRARLDLYDKVSKVDNPVLLVMEI
jgi:nucleoside-triphosphate--adenylate kinase